MDLSIIIVNYNVKHFLEHCLVSVQQAILGLQTEVFVVDNNSTDNSEQYFTNRFTNVKFIYNNENVGFAKGNNIALKKATGKYILFLNPDTIVPEDCFTKCINFFITTPNCGALGVRMIDGAGNFLKESKRSFPSPITSFYKLSGLARLFPRSPKYASYHLGHLSNTETHQVAVLAGAFMMIKKEVLNTVGSFDESFFMYGEDVDLSYRIQKAGYDNYYFAGTTIIHFKGESTKRGSLNYVRMFYKAMSQFVTKHYGQHRAATFNGFIQVAIFIRGSLSVLRRFILFVGLPLIDAGLILLCIWATKLFWYAQVRPDIKYIREIVVASAAIYTILYVVVGYLTGLYDKPFKQKNVNRSAIITTLLLLSLYGLLPEQYRFSRGIILLSAVVIFLTISLLRLLLVQTNILDAAKEQDEEKQTVVVASGDDFIIVKNRYQKAELGSRLLGLVATDSTKALASYEQWNAFSKTLDFTTVVYSANSLPYSTIIKEIEAYKKHKVKFYHPTAFSIVGSDSKDAIGESITTYGNFNIQESSAKRCKRLLDIATGLLFILFSPILILLVKDKQHYFSKFWNVLIGKKTLVGYNTVNDLPPLKNALFPNVGKSIVHTTLTTQALQELDYRYAKSYKCRFDALVFWKNVFL